MSLQGRLETKTTPTGVTLIELILVVAIISIIAVGGINFGFSFVTKSGYQNSLNQLTSFIRTAQINTISGKAGENWGVRSASGTLTLFKGNSYNPSEIQNIVYSIPQGVNISDFEVYFNKLSGDPSTTLTINTSSSSGQANQIYLNEVGIIDVN